MRKIIFKLIVAMIVFPGASYGEVSSDPDTGNDLLNACEAFIEGPESVSNSSLQAKIDWVSESEFCSAYIRGVVEWNGYYEKYFENIIFKPIFCIGDNQVEINQLVQIAVNYMNDHPEELHDKGITILESAFRQAFPCSAYK
ncbi:MAG: hypothetical protein HKP41_13440 [Desulfobacterales bacterium]|nr:hypothetical protein [Desulfobacterales bacterium]